MGARTVRHLARLGIAGAMVIVLTGCPEDAADIVEYKTTILNFDVAPTGDALLATGDVSIDGLVLADFDPTRDPDAFARGNANFTDYPVWDDEFGWIMAEPIGIADVDTRKPVLTMSAASYSYDYFDLSNGYYTYEGDWDFYGYVCCATPGADYVVGLERNALQVNGELDAEAVLLGQPITDPDSLFWLGGAPGGDHTRAADLYNYTAPYFAEQNANPYIFGYVTARASDGRILLDCVVSHADAGGATVWMPTLAPDQNLSIVAPNQVVPFDFPNYNYLTIWETNPDGTPDYSNPVARYQFGVDLDANGDPINNALAPFPDRAATDAELIAAPGGAGRPDSITVEVFNAEPLPGSNLWQAWLVNRDESPIAVAPATATYQRVAIVRERDPVTGEIISETDSILETVAATTTFTGQFTDVVNAEDQEIKHRLIITDASVGGGSGPGFFTDLVITEESGAATTPSSSAGIWFQYTDQNGTPTDYFDDSFGGGTLSFGHFVLDDPASSETFTAANWLGSRGLGGVRENEVTVEITNLPLPPIGYYYEGWLVGPDGSAVSLGPIKGLAPDTVSLFDADIDQDLPSVTATGIRFASVSAVLEGAIVSEEGGEYVVNLSSFYLTLEPKLGFGGAVKNVADLEVGSLPIETIINRMRNP